MSAAQVSGWNAYKETIKSESSIFEFARTGNVERLAIALSHAKNLEARTGRGYTPLMLASYNGHIEAADLLIQAGADVNTKDDGGNSVLMGAAFKGNSTIVQMLLQAGADPDYISPRGQSALLYAEMFGRREVANLLSHNRSLAWPLRVVKSWFKAILYSVRKKEEA
ncbi:MAG: ankyrin repeat domain-containing protein [Spirochaetia bacterium]|nr:ankyrin repeat domain-containing protein [Spirochaetia bacterium]